MNAQRLNYSQKGSHHFGGFWIDLLACIASHSHTPEAAKFQAMRVER